MIYTVVGFYEDPFEPYADYIEAESPDAAMQKAKCDTVIGAIEGEHPMFTEQPTCLECDGPKTGDDEDLCEECAATAVQHA